MGHEGSGSTSVALGHLALGKFPEYRAEEASDRDPKSRARKESQRIRGGMWMAAVLGRVRERKKRQPYDRRAYGREQHCHALRFLVALAEDDHEDAASEHGEAAEKDDRQRDSEDAPRPAVDDTEHARGAQ